MSAYAGPVTNHAPREEVVVAKEEERDWTTKNKEREWKRKEEGKGKEVGKRKWEGGGGVEVKG